MAHIENSAVTSNFDPSLDLDTDKIENAIKEAARIVSQFNLNVKGQTDIYEASKLVDFSISFLGYDVNPGAIVWELGSDENRVIDEDAGELVSTTVESVDKHKLTLAEDLFDKNDYYELQNLARIKKAEEYKASAIMFNWLRNKKQVEGVERKVLGPGEVEYGDIESMMDAFENPFEGYFMSVTGPVGY